MHVRRLLISSCFATNAAGAVQCLELDSERRVLYSASTDQSIVVWDFSNQDFATVELHGHQ